MAALLLQSMLIKTVAEEPLLEPSFLTYLFTVKRIMDLLERYKAPLLMLALLAPITLTGPEVS